jgi:hypothetical protein
MLGPPMIASIHTLRCYVTQMLEVSEASDGRRFEASRQSAANHARGA